MPLCGGLGGLQQATAETQQLVDQVRFLVLRSSRFWFSIVTLAYLKFRRFENQKCRTFLDFCMEVLMLPIKCLSESQRKIVCRQLRVLKQWKISKSRLFFTWNWKRCLVTSRWEGRLKNRHTRNLQSLKRSPSKAKSLLEWTILWRCVLTN